MTYPQRIPLNTIYLYGGSLLASALNYFYNLFMASEAYLGPAEYGALAALTSLLYLGSIAATTITTTTANYLATFISRHESSRVGPFIRRLSFHVTLLGLALGLLLLILSPFIARQLHLTSIVPVLLLAPTPLLSLLAAIIFGALQGLAYFGSLATVFITGAGLRLLLALLMVGVLPWGISGALIAALLATIIMYVLSLIPLRPFLFRQPSLAVPVEVTPGRELLGYTNQVFWVVLGITSLFSLDVVLAQHYLPAVNASIYGALSTLGRIIYFASLPITMIMFPLATKKFAARQPLGSIIRATSLAIAAIVLPVLLVYSFVPNLVIQFSLGNAYQAGSGHLWLFGLFYCLLTFATWLIYLALAQQKKIGFWPPLAVVTQVVLIFWWHDSVRQIVANSIVATLLLIAFILIRWQHED